MKELKRLVKVEFEKGEYTYTGYATEESLKNRNAASDIIPWTEFAEYHGLDPEDTDGEIWVDGRLLMDDDLDNNGNVYVLKNGFHAVCPVGSDSEFFTDTLYVQVTEFEKNQWIYPYGDANNIVSEPTHYFINENGEKIFLVEW